ncbi:MAG TPA: FecR domain-containing protein [Acidobacteriota bacterium]|nr:FecR domain-containing protein [Acidobacteriota bacterium]
MISSGKILLAILLAATAMAQHWVGVRAGMINYAEGVFYIDQEQLSYPDARLRAIPRGAILRTGNGWVEVQLGPDIFLWLGENGALRIEDPSLTNIQLILERGSALIEVSKQAKGSKFGILFGAAAIEPRKPGIYRLDSSKSQLSVYVGKAEIRLAGNKRTAKQGKAVLLAGELKSFKFDTRQMDNLQQNAANRSRVLSGVIQEAMMRSAMARTDQPRWYEARQMQQVDEQMRRVLGDWDYRQWEAQQRIADSVPIPSWPGQQEGHLTLQQIQTQQAIQIGTDAAQSRAQQPQAPPPQK